MMTPAHFHRRPAVVLETRVVKGSGGGPDKTILNSPRFLHAHGYDTICAYMHSPGDPGFEQLRIKAERWQAPLVSVDDDGPLDWRVLPRMLNLCRKHKVAIWHGHDYKSNLVGLILRRFWPMRLLTTVHGWVHHTNRTSVYYAIDRFCLPRYDCVLAVSEDLRQRSLECGVLPDRCHLIENAIDTDEFRRQRDPFEARNELGLPRDTFLIGGVGRLSPEKGFDVLLRSMAMLRQQGINAALLLVGEGEERQVLEELAVSLGIREHLHLAGFQGDTRPFYEAMDVFALSSFREGLPNVVLEAMAMETPVVATRIAGVPRVIDDGNSGLLIEPNSVEQLADAIRHLNREENLRRQLAAGGRRTIEERYSFARRMATIAALYDRLLTPAAPPEPRRSSPGGGSR
jgi:glycosyltransferase involved in cell wall biosynthesis